MNDTIRRELLLPQAPAQVWQAIATREALADWMYPNDFEPRVGHAFTFQVPGNPKVGFDGLTVRCEVIECEAPRRLLFSWKVGGPVANTRVSFRLEPEGDGTRLHFEHAGFDLAQPGVQQAFHGAQYGWARMLGLLSEVAARTGPFGDGAAIISERELSAAPERVFAAFADAAQLARWWGPNGFTNTFETFEFSPGGRWIFVMHGPNGADYPNECVVRELEPGRRLVIEHVVKPRYRLVVTLAPHGQGTRLRWEQTLEDAATAAKLRAFLTEANGQVLDRLAAVLAGHAN